MTYAGNQQWLVKCVASPQRDADTRTGDESPQPPSLKAARCRGKVTERQGACLENRGRLEEGAGVRIYPLSAIQHNSGCVAQ